MGPRGSTWRLNAETWEPRRVSRPVPTTGSARLGDPPDEVPSFDRWFLDLLRRRLAGDDRV